MKDLSMTEALSEPKYNGERIVAVANLQWGFGGLIDHRIVGDICLVRVQESGGTPGPTLCGLDRFAKDMPGWGFGIGSMEGQTACTTCAAVARNMGVPVRGDAAPLFGDWPRTSPFHESWQRHDQKQRERRAAR